MPLKKQKTPRGIRNNNPLNIRIGNNWAGEVSNPTDHAFEQFTEMKYGVRAAFIILHNYIVRHKLNTVTKIINRWAPASDKNDTKAYIKNVAKFIERGANEELSWDNSALMLNLFLGMCLQENGMCIELADVSAGLVLAKEYFKSK